MGILYSHIVFQPPSPTTYADEEGYMSFRKARNDFYDEVDDDMESDTHNTEAGTVGSIETSRHVRHPLLYLRTSKGNVIPAAYFHQPDSYYTILFSHGNGEDLGVTASYVLELSNSLKTSVLCYDYSGYGLATGKSSESNCYSDIRAAYTYLVSEQRVPRKRIILFGRSLGSGPTLDLASSLGPELGGVVLIAALTSCVRVVFNNVAHTMKFDMFANIDKIDKVLVPVFCVHGMADDVVPFTHGLELSRRARYPLEPLWIRHAGHNNLESSRFQYEVFLRYMKVLEEMRRWRRPHPVEDAAHEAARIASANGRRRDSFGRLGKVAGCFSLQRHSRGPSQGKFDITEADGKKSTSSAGISLDAYDCGASCAATDGESIIDEAIANTRLSSSYAVLAMDSPTDTNTSLSLAQLPVRFGRHSSKKRLKRHTSASSSHLYIPGLAHSKHESDLRALWDSEDDELVKRATGGIFKGREPRSRVLSSTHKSTKVGGQRAATLVQ